MKTLVLNYADLASGKSMNALKKAFAKTGTFVVTAETDNKEKKSAGIAFKTINLSFNDGQKISLDAKSTGDVFSVRLNGAVLPIKNHEDMGKAVGEIITAMDKGRKKFQAKQTRLKVDLPKGIKSTSKRQVEILQDRITELDMQIQEATAKRDSLKSEMGLDAVRSSKVNIGDAVHHPELNRTGTVRKYTKIGVEVRTTRGLEEWDFDDIEMVADDAFDFAGQPRDTDGRFSDGDGKSGNRKVYHRKVAHRTKKEGDERRKKRKKQPLTEKPGIRILTLSEGRK